MLDLSGWREWRVGAWRGCVPTDCPLCEARVCGGRLCVGCAAGLTPASGVGRCEVCCHPLIEAGCPDCGGDPPAFDRVVAAFDYVGAGEDLIRLYKVRRRFHLSAMLADLLADAVLRHAPAWPRSTILVPVPARREAILRRGFNPAAEVARALSSRLHWPVHPALLHRAQEGAKQALLGRVARLRALDGVYRCEVPPAGAHIVVVDDVLTTGSTLHHVAQLFRA
ncbi:MAG: ComF family protein, partial [Alcaligenaceae bacterium]|nr:ComF family protein [Alcaligenaceae bacterium]